MATQTQTIIRRITFLAAAACVVAMLQGCTVYEGCVNEYGGETSMGVHLAEACSRGVTFARKQGSMAGQQCQANYFEPRAQRACAHGARIYERGREGRILKEGLDF